MKIPELLHPEAIFVNLDAADSTAVITELGNRLLKLGAVKEGFVEATLAREASMPTGLPLMGEFNAALPHVDIEYVNRPALALATLTRPVIFKNMVNPDEDVPVSLVIMLALDQPKSQVEMLQEIAGLLQQPDVIDKLMRADEPAQVLQILEGLATPT
ncbi:MAG TPA: PTS sugar transporter subunit IIA [Aggregatilineales bacterium]|nr:PTS sugar transporter subunit IIA [Aggregatilineales bacterium]HPV07832.1 PTS sugar transporter subunit IIA [Aggregatilineales bacterium]HQA68213.1 PTS sugar transporter subunit IIA [Aggregatilineales bacterium]HQE17564.1 PTS sugar transporter subunit IIA [Aggregatilineales bacterium]